MTEEDYAMFAQFAGDQKVGEGMRDVLFNAVLPERTAEAHRTILTRCSPADDPAQPAVHRYGGEPGR